MSPEILSVLYTVGGLAVGWIARHYGLGASSSPAKPVVAPVPPVVVVPATPVVTPAGVPSLTSLQNLKTGNPLMDALLADLLNTVQQELQAKFSEITQRVLPPLSPAPVVPAVPTSLPVGAVAAGS